MKVCLDPGHYGNYNQGYYKAYFESVAMLKLGFMLRDELQRCGIQVIMTRTNTSDLSLSARGSMAGKNGCSLFISLHTNACDTPSVRGGEAFYSVDLPNDKSYAQELSNAVCNAIGTSNRGAKVRESTNYKGEDYYGVIDSAQDSGCPHVFIIEHAFHSNPEDCKLLMDDNVLKRVAIAEAKVICSRHGITYVAGNGSTTAPSTPAVTPSTNVGRGDSGEVVSMIQTKLNRFGYGLAVDGHFGALTEGAVKDFQSKHGLSVDGIVGTHTMAMLDSLIAEMDKPKEAEMYRVRKDWADASSQIGAYTVLDNAKAMADSRASEGYKVFNNAGSVVYTPAVKQDPPVVVDPPKQEPVKHAVMGVAECTIDQCETFLHKVNANAPYLADVFKAQCESEGVRFDIAFAQSILETGYFRFGGDVKIEQNNFAGIGAVGGGASGASFPSAEVGILAQAQHLKAYASAEALNKPCVDPRYDLISPHGKAPYIEDFGNGIWASSTDNYGGRIYQLVEAIKATVADPQYKKPEPPVVEEPNKEGFDLLAVVLEALKKFFEYILKKL